MSNKWDPNFKGYDILWDDIGLVPKLELKFGIARKKFSLTKQFTQGRSKVYYANRYIELKGKWDNSPNFGSLLSLNLKNLTKETIRITRLTFPIENGLDYFLGDFKPKSISFLRNGYQSWSTSRSYRLTDKPIRPWLPLVSLTSSNMANLPSNVLGLYSSEMYTLISNVSQKESFLVGQTGPFNQFLYIKLHLTPNESKKSHIEITFDFGRKLLKPGETMKLDGILLARGETTQLQRDYFEYIKQREKIQLPQENIRGWSSWYVFFNKVSPDQVKASTDVIKKRNIDVQYIQLDDGYQTLVGDWFSLQPAFKGEMRALADYIRDRGFTPGIWLAPFIADRKAMIIKENPHFLLRNEYGKPIVCGYNPWWPGKLYYSLDITNPEVEEYIRKVVRTMVKDWGFRFLKLDFLFGACMRGGQHLNQSLTKAEVLKYGISVIRDEVGKEVILEGCGMPISPGIGMVNTMRVGPDTAPFWHKWTGPFLQTQAMLGVRNSIRNFTVRAPMHKRLWVNDPDCMILRKNTSLNHEQYETQINAIILSGGMLMFSDDFATLDEQTLEKLPQIIELSKFCYQHELLALDVMESEIPQVLYNTAGILGVFNYSSKTSSVLIDLKKHKFVLSNISKLHNVWTDEIIELENESTVLLPKMKAYSSALFYLE